LEVQEVNLETAANAINYLCNNIHDRCKNAGWWNDIYTGEPLDRNKAELICLMHSELSEALEGVRKNLPDDKLPHRKMEEVELADVLIRIFDYAGAYSFDLGGAMVEKLEYNANREDHKLESRLKPNGKKI
jgi:hypothetical protein